MTCRIRHDLSDKMKTQFSSHTYLVSGAATEIHAFSPMLVKPAVDVAPAVRGPVHMAALAVVIIVVVARHRSVRHHCPQVVVGLDV